MPHLELPLNGTSYFTDSEGLFNTDVSQEVADVPVQLRGLFATVFTNGVTPLQSTTFVNDFNNLTAPGQREGNQRLQKHQHDPRPHADVVAGV